MQLILDGPLKELASTGWETSWFAVRSHVNSAAHACANDAVLHAHNLRMMGLSEPFFAVTEYPECPPPP
eukprot:8192323-Heterocapsa_arctica.AAC.1